MRAQTSFRTFAILLISLLVLSSLPASLRAQETTLLTVWSSDYFSPDIVDPNLTVGSLFVVELRVEGLPPDGTNGFDIVLNYNSSVLRATDAYWNCLASDGCLFGSPSTILLAKQVDSPTGTVRLAVVLLGEFAYGSGILFKVVFQVVGTGYSLIDIREAESFIVFRGGAISYASQDGSFDNQSPPEPGFGISIFPASGSVAPGDTIDFLVSLSSILGFGGTLTLSASVSPEVADGPSASVDPPTVDLPPDGTAGATVRVSTISSTPLQSYSVTVTASDGVVSHDAESTLTLTPRDFILSVEPTVASIGAGSSTSFLVDVESVSGFEGDVTLQVFVYPSPLDGPATLINPEVVSLLGGGSANSSLLVTTQPQTPTGGYVLTVGSFSGNLNHTASVTLIVTPPPDFAFTDVPAFLNIHAGESTSTIVGLLSLGFEGLVYVSANITADGVTASITPNPVPLSAYSAASFTLDLSAGLNLTLGDHKLTLTATSESLSHTVSIGLSVKPGNQPPIASFVFYPQNPFVGDFVIFDGFPSIDPDGFITSWFWGFGDGSVGYGQFVTHSFPSPGTFEVMLTVNDNLGASSSTTIPVTVRTRALHDVAVEQVFVYLDEAVAGQLVNIQVILENNGLRDETVDLTVYYGSNIVDTVTGLELESGSYRYLPVLWDTTGVLPGAYIISATVFLATDEFPEDNTGVDGSVTILPPPVVTVTPGSGELGTKVLVEGSGFPSPLYGPAFSIMLVSFDDMFLGYSLANNGVFEFTLSVPHAEPGSHFVKVLDVTAGVRASAEFQVLGTPEPPGALSISVDVGSIYFPGETADIYILATMDGVRVNYSALSVVLVKPDRSNIQLAGNWIGPGLYKASYSIPASNSIGTYAVVVSAALDDSSISYLVTFRVTPSWLSQQGPRLASAAAFAGVIATVAVAMRRGYFRRNKEDPFPLLSEPSALGGPPP